MSIETADEESRHERLTINDLPTEVLCLIFWFNTLKEYKPDGTLVHDRHRTTLASSQVCRHWRSTAMSHSTLWSRIIDYERHPRFWIAELLARSQESRLEIGEQSMFKPVLLRSPRADWALDLIFKNARRIQTFTLNIRFQPWDILCRSFLRHPAPSIEFLSITTAVPFPDCVLTTPLFADDAPHLRALHLERCLIPFTSSALHNLTELSVHNIVRSMSIGTGSSNPFKIAPTPNQWLAILDNIPSLRYLTLASAISPPNAVPDDPPPVDVSLPHLALFSVRSTLSSTMAMMEHMSIPSDCGLRFRLKNSRMTQSDLSQLTLVCGHQLESWAQNPSSRYFQAKLLSGDIVHIGNSRRVGQIWNMTEAEVLEEHHQKSSDPLLWLVFSIDSSERAADFLKSMFAFYDGTYQHTTELDLWIDNEFSTMAPERFFKPCLDSFSLFENLGTLCLLEQSPLYILPLLQHSSTSTLLLFPALQTLVATGTQFEDEERSGYFTVVAFLLWRIEVKHPISSLHITESKISERTHDGLSKLPGGVKVSVGPRDSLPPRPQASVDTVTALLRNEAVRASLSPPSV